MMAHPRVRSRAYKIQVNCGRRVDIDDLLRWLSEHGACWLLAERGGNVEAYIRFHGTVSISRIAPNIRGALVEPTTVSFKRIVSEYKTDSGITNLRHKEMERGKTTIAAKQGAIDDVLRSKGKHGVVAWVNYVSLDDKYLEIMRAVNQRTDVLVSNENQAAVYELVREELIARKRAVKGIILLPSEKTSLDFEYLQFLSELRSGLLTNSRFGQTQFTPLNVVVLSRKGVSNLGEKPLPLDIREIYV